jgi:3-dehydroquinate synthase
VARDLFLRFPSRRPVSRVRIRAAALDHLGAFVRSTTRGHRLAVVADVNVAALYAPRALEALRRAGLEATLVTVPAGERSKSARMLAHLWEQLASLELERGDAVVALGGGVVGDLAGFGAATWLRGIDWVGVPTSLMAQVDSSIGGKTAIDLAAGKNLVGAFHQPVGVLVDPELLKTLPIRHLRAGLAEVVKMGMAVDAALFRWTERHAARILALESEALDEVVTRSILAKAKVVRQDPWERPGGTRTALNYGHTVGHALEAALEYRRLLHGEAVAIGMGVAGLLSERHAGLPPDDRRRQDALLARLGLRSTPPPIAVSALLEAMNRDKKRGGGKVRWVLTTRMGHASVPRSIPGRLVQAALLEAGARA